MSSARRAFPVRARAQVHPCDAPKEKLWALRDYLGFERNVLVQATCHGADNRALVDALRAAVDRARGVATVTRNVSTPSSRTRCSRRARRALQFRRRLVDVTPQEVLAGIARRSLAARLARGHLFRGRRLAGAVWLLRVAADDVVVDHMGRPDVTQPVDGPGFELFVRLMREHRTSGRR